MRFFQKKLVVSYAAITFSLVSVIIAMPLVRFIGQKVFLGYFISTDAVAVMFFASPPPEPYRWPFSATYGLLAGYNIGELGQDRIILAAAVIGVLAVAFVWGLMLSVAHIATRKILYGDMVSERKKILRYIKKTVVWNTIFAAGIGIGNILTYTLTANDMMFSRSSGSSDFLVITLFVAVFVVVVFVRQHALNKWVSMDWQPEKEAENA